MEKRILMVENRFETSENKQDRIYYVPVRGLINFHQVNKYAEFLDLSSGGNNFSEKTAALKRERDELVKSSNPSVPIRLMPAPATVSGQPPIKIARTSTTVNEDPLSAPRGPTTGSKSQIFKPSTLLWQKPGSHGGNNVKTVRLAPAQPSNMQTIVLPPRTPLGQGRQATVAIKTENSPEETDDEGDDLPDSFGVPNDADADGIAEFRKTISY